jgi:hypothetical protein
MEHHATRNASPYRVNRELGCFEFRDFEGNPLKNKFCGIFDDAPQTEFSQILSETSHAVLYSTSLEVLMGHDSDQRFGIFLFNPISWCNCTFSAA